MAAGRPKGMPNKIGAAVKSNVVAVFDSIGGRDGMASWAKENLSEFYRLYARLIPTESSTEITIRDVTELSRAELILIATGGSAGAAGEGQSGGEPDGLH
jgi:hypothetical protein